jgi:PleD family two-component response regulator
LPPPVPPKRLPRALIASDQEWCSRSLETILAPGGYVVLHAHTGQEALNQARRSHADIILLDAHLPDQTATDLCRALRQNPDVGLSTPIILLALGPPTKQQRLAALRAGAWELLSLPVDPEELLLKLAAYVHARVEADQAREEGLVDHATGLYNVRGLARRARELGSEALRHRTALACVVFGADLGRQPGATAAGVAEHIARGLHRAGRVSDAIGRLGHAEFAVVAPSTNGSAAVRLAERMIGALGRTPEAALGSGPLLRAGYDAVENLHATPVEAVDLLVHATTALEHARADGNGERIRRYAQPTATV